jgi:sterol desaturase/sphingolipid hydroxylase (fatty acid hydroxylase superfamily)
MKNFKSFIIYPIFGIAPVALLVYLYGHFPNSGLLLSPVIYVLSFTAVLTLERIFSWNQVWNQSKGDGLLDIEYLVANLVVSHSALAIYFFFSGWRYGLGENAFTHLHFFFQYGIALLIFDFGLYAVHRLSHGNGFFWRLHAIHHSSERIYSTNGQKRHLLHEILEGSPGLLVLFALGARPEVVAAVIYTVSLHLLLQHANIRYRVGPLRYIFSVAELHRWHHQRDWKDVQGNYGAVFSFWDLLLGTMLPMRGEAPAQVGLEDQPELARLGFVKQHLKPFN